MNLLLDTHVALWAITDSPKLSDAAHKLILSPRATIWISTASLWEIAINYSLGRGDMPVSAAQAKDFFERAGYQLLAIDAEHTIAVESLPSHHQDPFDRILIAQALTEPMRLLTHDALVARYSDSIVRIQGLSASQARATFARNVAPSGSTSSLKSYRMGHGYPQMVGRRRGPRHRSGRPGHPGPIDPGLPRGAARALARHIGRRGRSRAACGNVPPTAP